MSRGTRTCLNAALKGCLAFAWLAGGMRVDAASDIYVSVTSGGGSVLDYNGTLTALNGSLTDLGAVQGLAVGPSGNVYVANDAMVAGPNGTFPGLLTSYNAHLTTPQANSSLTTGPLFTIPGALSINQDNGDVYIGRHIVIPSPATDTWATTHVDASLTAVKNTNGGYGSQLYGAAFSNSSAGNSLVVSWGLAGGVIASFNPAQNAFNGYSGSMTPPLGTIHSIVTGPDGSIYVQHEDAEAVPTRQVAHFPNDYGGNGVDFGLIGTASVGTAANGPIAVSFATTSLGNVYIPQSGGLVEHFGADLSSSLGSVAVPGTVTAIKVDPATGNVLIGTSDSGGKVFMYDAGLATLLHSTAGGLGTINGIDFSPATVALIGDINHNGSVELVDYGILKGNWLQNVATGIDGGDLNVDGVVNITDFAVFKQAYINFNGGGGGELTSVPEPSAVVLAAFALPCWCYLMWRRRASAIRRG